MTTLDFMRAVYGVIAISAIIIFIRLGRRRLGFDIIVYAALVTLFPGIAFFIVRYFIHDTALLNFMSIMVYITTALCWLLTGIALWQGSKAGKRE